MLLSRAATRSACERGVTAETQAPGKVVRRLVAPLCRARSNFGTAADGSSKSLTAINPVPSRRSKTGESGIFEGPDCRPFTTTNNLTGWMV